MKQNRSFAALIFLVIMGVGGALAYACYRNGANMEAGGIGIGMFVLAVVVASAIQVADQWDRARGGGWVYRAAVSASRSTAGYTPRVTPRFDGGSIPLENPGIPWQR
jgi:hypothetical protein